MLPKKRPAAGPRRRLTAENLERLKGHLSKLAPEDLQVLIPYLQELVAEVDPVKIPPQKRDLDVVKEERTRRVVYRQEYVKCGKKGCHCAEGQGHGPYWYAYYRSPRSGRVVSKYLGKEKKELKPR